VVEWPENVEAEDAVENERSSAGHAKSAGVGDVDGDGEEVRMYGGVGSASVSMMYYGSRLLVTGPFWRVEGAGSKGP